MPRRFLVVLVSFALGTVVVTASPVQGATSECEGSTSMYCEEWVFHLDGWNRSSSPVIADIDADGLNEIVFGHQDGKLRAYEADGTLKWESLAVPGVAPGCTSQTSASAIDSSPAVADLDNDGIPEVVVGVGSTWVSNQNGSVIAFNGKTGAMIWNFDRGRDEGNTWANTGTPDGYCGHVFATPAIGDIDGDGKLDVVFASWDFQIWAVDRFGEPLSGFPVNNDDSVWSSPALFDLDSDGDNDMLVSRQAGTFVWMNDAAPPVACGISKYDVGASAANTLDLTGTGSGSGGTTIALTTTGINSASAFQLISAAKANVAFSGGVVLIDTGSQLIPMSILPAVGGQTVWNVAIPGNPAYVGFAAHFQTAAFDAGLPGGLAFSNGVELIICP